MSEKPYYTVDVCTGCGAEVAGLHNRWTCTSCGENSPYEEPPEGWRADIGYREPPKPSRASRFRRKN